MGLRYLDDGSIEWEDDGDSQAADYAAAAQAGPPEGAAQAEWYGDTDTTSPGLIGGLGTQPSAPSDSHSWYSDGDPATAAQVASYASQVMKNTTGLGDLVDSLFGAVEGAGSWLSKAGSNLMDKIQKNPDEALKFFGTAVGSVMKSRAEREAMERKYQEERDKESRLNSSVPKYTKLRAPSLIGSVTKRSDGQPYFLPNGNLNKA